MHPARERALVATAVRGARAPRSPGAAPAAPPRRPDPQGRRRDRGARPGRDQAARLDAPLAAGGHPGLGAAALAGDCSRRRPPARRDGPRPRRLRASGGAARSEVGPLARGPARAASSGGSRTRGGGRSSAARSAASSARSRPRCRGCADSVIHGDANDHNVVVGDPRVRPRAVTRSSTSATCTTASLVAEPAIAAVYALLGKPDPLARDRLRRLAAITARCRSTSRRSRSCTTLIAARLAVSVTNVGADEDEVRDPYVTHQRSAGLGGARALARDPSAPGPLPVPRGLRVAAVPHGPRVDRLARPRRTPPRCCRPSTCGRATLVLDLGVSSRLLGADPAAAETARADADDLRARWSGPGPPSAVGRYDEPRLLYSSALVRRRPGHRRAAHRPPRDRSLRGRRAPTVHAPLDGVVHVLANNRAELGLRTARDPAPRRGRRHDVLHPVRPPERGHPRRPGRRTARRPRRGVRARRHVRPRTAAGLRTSTSR